MGMRQIQDPNHEFYKKDRVEVDWRNTALSIKVAVDERDTVTFYYRVSKDVGTAYEKRLETFEAMPDFSEAAMGPWQVIG